MQRSSWTLSSQCSGVTEYLEASAKALNSFQCNTCIGKCLHALNLLEQCHETDLTSGHQSDRRMPTETSVTCKRVKISQVQQCFLDANMPMLWLTLVQRSGAHLEGVIKYLSHRISLSISRHDRGRILSSHSHRHVICFFLNTSEYF